MKIHLVNLPPHLNAADIRQLFERYGEVASVKIMTEKNTGTGKGCAYLEMPDSEQAAKAVYGLQGVLIDYLEIIVTVETDSKNKVVQ